MTSSSLLYTSHPSLTNVMSTCNINNNNNNNMNNSINSSLNSSNGINNPLNSSNGFDISNIDQCLKHCGCRNPKELIQLIRSDAIENIELSWPDDMGLWFVNVIKSHEVSLQNLVEGIKVTGQILLVDPTSARFDLSKKQKTILIRCSNINRYSSSSSSSSSSDDDYEEEEELDGEVVKSPQSKFSLLLDESEKLRKSFKSSAPAFFKPKNSSGGGGNSSPSSPPTKALKYHQSGAAGGTHERYTGKRSSSNNYTATATNQQDQDLDASWIEDMKKNNRIELVPDLSSPFYSSNGMTDSGCSKRSPSPLLGGSSCLSSSSGSSSPGLPIETTDSPPGVVSNSGSATPDLTTVDSAERAILEGQIHLPPLLRPRQYHACKIPKEDRPSKRRKNHTSLFCRHCGTTDTPEWRRGPDGRKSLCNACGLHYSKLVKRENMAVPQLSRTFDISELLNPTD
ncbi:hypothetical protein CYY_009036 [Polysphondylium violaceum]|uniref:GATA-type domain-containing protein n=1 Tax=Polysphondylium violaceum TaxID=133409 RepID=A0A8J4PKT7_9MYCE|nr:hypothetical protein CYY_009036 [Polysphondylium violaceum]